MLFIYFISFLVLSPFPLLQFIIIYFRDISTAEWNVCSIRMIISVSSKRVIQTITIIIAHPFILIEMELALYIPLWSSLLIRSIRIYTHLSVCHFTFSFSLMVSAYFARQQQQWMLMMMQQSIALQLFLTLFNFTSLSSLSIDLKRKIHSIGMKSIRTNKYTGNR